jgi:hypothetical protein
LSIKTCANLQLAQNNDSRLQKPDSNSPEPLPKKNLTNPKEPVPTGRTQLQDSNPDLAQLNITKTALAKRPNLTDPKLDLRERPLLFDLHGATRYPSSS